MGSRGPKKGALNAGRPKIEFTRDQWTEIEKYVSHQCKITEVCDEYKVSYSVLERMIRDSYGLTITEFWDRYSNKGKMQLREIHWKRITDEKCNPLIFIHAIANYLKFVNTNQITADDSKDKKDNTLLKSIYDGFKKLSNKQPQVLTQINNYMQSPPLQLDQPTTQPKHIHAKNITDAEIQQVVKDNSNNDIIDVDNMLITCEQDVDKSVLPPPNDPIKQ
jgi:hypothetical protein